MTFYRLFRALDPKPFEAFFRRWVSQIGPSAAPPGQMVIDGKAIRGSADGAHRPAHIVSAFSIDLGIVFGQEFVEQKSNVITAIPELLEALYVKAFWLASMPWACRRPEGDRPKDHRQGRRLPFDGQGKPVHLAGKIQRGLQYGYP